MHAEEGSVSPVESPEAEEVSPEKIMDKLGEKERKEWRGKEVSVFKDSGSMFEEIAKQLRPGKDIIIIPPPPEKPGKPVCARTLLVLIGEYEGQDTGRLRKFLEWAYVIVKFFCKGITKYIIFYAAVWNAIFYAREYKEAFDKIEEIEGIWLKMPFTEPVRLK